MTEIFPQNGRVILIDDQIDQVKPLMRILSENGVKYSYFSGRGSDKPNDPLQDIRLVFLDLKLRTIGTTPNPEAEARHIIRTLKEIISDKNSLYILLIWSMDPQGDIETNLQTMIENETTLPHPLKTIYLEKLKYFKLKRGTQNMLPRGDERKILGKLQRDINSEISKEHFFHIFSYWDNIVSHSSNEVINSFSEIYENSPEYNRKMMSVIYELALANAGKTLKKDKPTDVVNNALFTLSSAFFDSFEKNLLDQKYPFKILPYHSGDNVTDEIKAKINTKIFTAATDSTYIPGMVYREEDDTDTKKGIRTSIIVRSYEGDTFRVLFCQKNDIEYHQAFDERNQIKIDYKDRYQAFKREINKKIKEDPILISCVVTPACDYAQNKFENHRAIFGLLWPWELYSVLRDHADYMYISDVIKYETKNYCFVLDFGYFHSCTEGQLTRKKKKKIMRLRQEILVDIQSKLASHVHRPGLMSLK
jgi:hypothetical protein